MIGVNYDSKHSYNNFKTIARSISRPLLPALRKNEMIIPGRDGTYDFGENTYDNTPIVVLLQYIGDTFVDLRLQSRQIAAWLSKKAYKKLIFDDEPDKYYMAKVYDAVDLVVADLLEFGKATVTFECQPFAYSVDEDLWIDRLTEDTEIIQNGGTVETFPIIKITPVVLSGGMDEAVEVTGVFDPAEPVVTVTTLTNPAITIGDDTLVYEGTILVGQTLLLNTEKYQATKDGSNVLNKVSGDWPVLEVGSNDISIVDTSSECGATVEILYRKRWL